MAGRMVRPSAAGYLPIPADDIAADERASNLDTFFISRTTQSSSTEPEEVDPLSSVAAVEHRYADTSKSLATEDKHSDSASSSCTPSVSMRGTVEDDEDISELELRTLRVVSDKLPLAAWLVAVVELCERFTYYGLTGPFMNYMQYPAGGLRPGAIGLGQAKASALNYFFQFWCYVTPIMGAIIADQYWGKYRTIFLFALMYVTGLLILVTTSIPMAIANGASLGGLIVAMIIIGLGTGGIKANVSPLIAEQYTRTKKFIRTLKSGERVIVDPAVTIQSLFMVFYMCINIGSLSAIATTELELQVGFWAAYLLPFLFFFFAIATLVFGSSYYVKKAPSGSVIPHAFKIVCIGAASRSFAPAKPSVRADAGLPPVPWTENFVDEVSRALDACKVFVFYPIYWLVYGQMVNNFISQAGQMDTHGIPNDIMQNIDPIGIIVFIPICDSLLYPFLRRIGIPFRPISRIFMGFMFAAVAMAYAAVLQNMIYSVGPCYDHPLACDASEGGTIPNQIHVAMQTPAYIFIALSEIFASVTGLEFAYMKAPASMKSFVMSVFLLTNAFGAALGIAISPTAKDPDMVRTYTGLAVVTTVAGIIFFVLFRKYNRDDDESRLMERLDDDNFQERVVEEQQASHNLA
ncbi:POT family-domain-containing protein [Limtongia smithiae]|uniref:POT family-domain-containing protein n=1 Tax=Limtongia smithiae TaxID=1125753 RepID=UPI0034CE12A9